MHHMGVDFKGKRLFVPVNGDNQNSVEVIRSDVEIGHHFPGG
jgi:hypothetical protein